MLSALRYDTAVCTPGVLCHHSVPGLQVAETPVGLASHSTSQSRCLLSSTLVSQQSVLFAVVREFCCYNIVLHHLCQGQDDSPLSFAIDCPGGHANLAFREHEDPKPYKKKTSISVFSADLQESSFIIPAVRGNSGTKEPTSTSAVQPDNNDTTHARIMASEMSEHAECDCHEQEALGLAAAITSLPAVQRPVAHTASQTSPNKCMHEDNELQPCTL